ncbi:hypothetical protein D047_0407B, partial [Vibrio parahaemolyticus VPTS-2010_2]
KYQ